MWHTVTTAFKWLNIWRTWAYSFTHLLLSLYYAFFARCAWNESILAWLCLSVRPSVRIIQRENRWWIWMKFGMDVMPFGTTLKSYFLIFYNRQHQYGRWTNLWGGIDTSATSNRVIQWWTVIDFRKIQNFVIKILCIMRKSNTASWKKKKLPKGFDLMTLRVQVIQNLQRTHECIPVRITPFQSC
jgi:hypothetical protein